MNWLHFLTWIAGIYLSYYLENIIYDFAASKRAPADKSLTNVLTFSEEVQIQRLADGPEKEGLDKVKAGAGDTRIKIKAESEVIASGGVCLKDLFKLARQESIIYTRPVSF
jgi:hypothetical protein